MKCDDLDKFLIFIIVINLIANILTLFASLIGQKCEKEKEQERQEYDEYIKQELAALNNRIASLEQQLASAGKG